MEELRSTKSADPFHDLNADDISKNSKDDDVAFVASSAVEEIDTSHISFSEKVIEEYQPQQ